MSTYMPSLREITVNEMRRLWNQYTEQSMEAVCKSLHIEMQLIEDRLGHYQIRKDEVIKNPWEDQRVQQLFLDREFISRMERVRDQKCRMLRRYLAQKGWEPSQSGRIGIVDIGWKGTIQDNLCHMYPRCQIVGFYIGLQPFFAEQPKNSRKYGYINAYKYSDVILFTVRPLEMLCNSANGSVQSYAEKNGRVCAVKKSDAYEDAVYWSYTRKVQSKIKVEMDRLIQKASAERCRPVKKAGPGGYQLAQKAKSGGYCLDQRQAMRTIYRFIAYPDRRTVSAYFSLRHNEEFGVGSFIDVAAELHLRIFLKCVYDHTARIQLKEMLKEASWPQGYFVKYWMYPMLVPYNHLLRKYLKQKELNPIDQTSKEMKPAKSSVRYQTNKEMKSAKSSAGYQTNRETKSAKSSAGYQTNRETKSAKSSAGYQMNKEMKSAKSSAGYQMNKEMKSAKSSAGYQTNRELYSGKNGQRKAAWVLPRIIEGSGGHRTIFQCIRCLISHGYACDVYIEGIGSQDMQSKKELRRVKTLVERCFGAVGCRYYLGYKLNKEYDIIFATAWHTAKIVGSYAGNAKKAYFIQDHEASFQPAGEKYLKACDSYCQGLSAITIGRWLSWKMMTDYKQPAQYFDFCANREVYKNTHNHKKRGVCQKQAICFIYQPEKTRRCPNLGIAALGIVKYLRPSVKIYLYGSESKGTVWFEHENLKILSEKQCNALYNQCTVGLCISSTNPSRIPFEMMAAGLPVVDIYMENNLYDMPDQGVSLAHYTPESIAQALLEILDDDEKRTKMSEYGQAFMKGRTLEYGLEQFYRCVENIMNDTGPSINLQQGADPAMYVQEAEKADLKMPEGAECDQGIEIHKIYKKKAVRADRIIGMLTAQEWKELEDKKQDHSLIGCLKRNPYIKNSRIIQSIYLKWKAF